MGWDASAYAVIGVKANPDDFVIREKKKKRICKHKFDSKFCPDCGCQKYTEIVEETSLLEENERFEEEFRGFSVIKGIDDNDIYIGIAPGGETSSNGGPWDAFLNISDDDIRETREELKKELEPLGLWNERAFGLWAVLSGG